MSKAVYCRCRNTYSIECKDKDDCPYPDYWKQGIGSLTKEPED